MASNPYNNPGAVASSGLKTYSKADVKAGRVNPYNQFGADSADSALQEQKQIQQTQQKAQKLAAQVAQQPSQPNSQPKPSLANRVANDVVSASKKTANFAKDQVTSTVGAAKTTLAPIENLTKLAAAKVTANNAAAENARIAEGKLTPHQVYGSAAQTAVLGIPGVDEIPGAPGIVSKVAPKLVAKVAEKTSGKGIIPSLTRAAVNTVKQAPVGAGYSAAQAATENESPKEVFESAGKGAALTGALGGVGSLLKSAAPHLNPLNVDLAPEKTAIFNKTLENAKDESKTPYDTPEVIKMRELQDSLPSTHMDNSPERQALREHTFKTLDKQGGFANPKNTPTSIATGKRADIIIGLPGSGKTSIVDKIIKEHQSRLIDSDEAKKMLGDTNLSGTLHQESDQIAKQLLQKSVRSGENVVLPLVGKNSSKISGIIDALKAQGYDVHGQYMHVSPDTAAQRVVSRFNETGKFVDPHYVLNKVGLSPDETYGIMKSHEGISTLQKHTNEVPFGEQPKLVEESGVRQRPSSTGRQQGAVTTRRPERAKPETKRVTQKTAVAEKPQVSLGEVKPQPVEQKPLTSEQTKNMPEVAGYTHSTALAKDYADMLHSIDDGVKGGQMVPDGEGGYKRITEHSRFYRDYYAANKRAPSKAAWLEQAVKELESGKAAYGASDDYKQLVSREMPKPAEPITEAKSTSAPEDDTFEGPTKTSGVAKSIQAKAIESNLTKGFENLAEFKARNIEEQSGRVADLIVNDEAKMRDIVSGKEALPEGMSGSLFIKGVEDFALNTNDTELLRSLVSSHLTSETSIHASELRLLAERDPDGPVAKMQEVINARKKAPAEKIKGSVEAQVNKTAKSIAVRVKTPTRMDWNTFVESIKC